METIPTEISFTIRMSSQTIELSGLIHKKSIYVLVDSGSTSNYISDEIAYDFDLIIQLVSFWLQCGDYNSEVIARVFPNMRQQLILGIPWLKQENHRID